MTKRSPQNEIRYFTPQQCGWLRRPELTAHYDEKTFEVWEKPNGDLLAHDLRCGPLKVAVRRAHYADDSKKT